MANASDLLRSPFLRAWAQKQGLTEPRASRITPDRIIGVPVRTAADVLGERDAYAFGVLTGQMETPASVNRAGLAALADDILAAVPVMWLNELAKAARDIDIPQHQVSPDAMPHPLMWWTFEGAQPVTMSDGSEFLMDAQLLKATPTSLLSFGFGSSKSGPVMHLLEQIRWREVYPRSVKPEATLAMLAFMQSSKLAERIPMGTPRSERRRLPAMPPVEFIRLRRTARQPSDGGQSGSGHDYSVRWIVSGHMRAQWYPSARAHRLIWIEPYTKGPEGAPLKKALYKVVQ